MTIDEFCDRVSRLRREGKLNKPESKEVYIYNPFLDQHRHIIDLTIDEDGDLLLQAEVI